MSVIENLLTVFARRLALLLFCACSAASAPAAERAPMPPAARPAAPAPATPAPPAVAAVTPVELPKLGTNAKHRRWVHAGFGPREDQFGMLKLEDGSYPPQGFVPTADGRLLVVDTAKARLTWFAHDGELEKTLALPEGFFLPSDVAVARDGTIAVISDSGRTVVFDAQGNAKKDVELQNERGVIYAAGDDFYVNVDGLSSLKIGNTKGRRDDDTKGVYRGQDGRIPGNVTPDGTTVLSIGEDEATGSIFVSAIRGSAGEQVWKRSWPITSGIPFVQADAAGRIYVVINHLATLALVCVDARTGDPVGMVQLPDTWRRAPNQLRDVNVDPRRGIVFAAATHSEVSFEWFDCHP